MKITGFIRLGRQSHKMIDFFAGQRSSMMNEPVLSDDPASAVVVLSDVWLDLPRVVTKLRQLCDGFTRASFIPAVIVLMGDFLSPESDCRSYAAESVAFNNAKAASRYRSKPIA
jgi:hypothetical protein